MFCSSITCFTVLSRVELFYHVFYSSITCFTVLSRNQVHTQDVKKVVWHPTDPLLFSASYDDTVKIYKEFGDDWECAESLTGKLVCSSVRLSVP